MVDQSLQLNLRQITAVFLDPAAGPGALFKASRDLRDLFYQCCGFDPALATHREHVLTEHGQAIGPTWAAMCIEDFARTRAFLRGIDAAIAAQRLAQADRGLRILYLGPGPFATLLMPLLVNYRPDQLQIDVVEINPETHALLKQTICALGFSAFFDRIDCADAMSVSLADRPHYDLVICEALLVALQKEPQVAITMHFARQMHADSIWIPQQIDVSIALANIRYGKSIVANDEPAHSAPLPLLSLHKGVRELDQLHLRQHFSIATHELDQRFQSVILLTQIQVYADIHIRFNQSGLSIAKRLAERDQFVGAIAGSCQYQLGDRPGLQIRWASELIS